MKRRLSAAYLWWLRWCWRSLRRAHRQPPRRATRQRRLESAVCAELGPSTEQGQEVTRRRCGQPPLHLQRGHRCRSGQGVLQGGGYRQCRPSRCSTNRCPDSSVARWTSASTDTDKILSAAKQSAPNLRYVAVNFGQEFIGLAVRPGINTVADLRGKTIGAGIANSRTDNNIRELLTENGVDLSNVKVGEYRRNGQRPTAGLIAGTFDAATLQARHRKFIEDAGGKFLLENTRAVPQIGWATDRLLTESPETVAAFLTAVLKARAYIDNIDTQRRGPGHDDGPRTTRSPRSMPPPIPSRTRRTTTLSTGDSRSPTWTSSSPTRSSSEAAGRHGVAELHRLDATVARAETARHAATPSPIRPLLAQPRPQRPRPRGSPVASSRRGSTREGTVMPN